MQPLYWVAAVVMMMYMIGVRGLRGTTRAVFSLGAAATVAGLIGSATGKLSADHSPILLILFCFGILAGTYAGIATVIARRSTTR